MMQHGISAVILNYLAFCMRQVAYTTIIRGRRQAGLQNEFAVLCGRDMTIKT